MADQIITIDPATGAELRRYDTHDRRRPRRRAGRRRADPGTVGANRPQGPLRPSAARSRDPARPQTADLAALAVTEMGKPVTEALGEVEKCAWVCEYYAQESQAVLADEVVVASGSRSWVSYEPLGIVLAIMPWNFPYWQVFRFAAPTLAAGNAGLLKHSPNVSGCRPRHPAGVRSRRSSRRPVHAHFVIAEPDVPDAVENLIADDRIAAVTPDRQQPGRLPRRRRAGRAVKKSVLELGGSDPFVVLADADLDAVVAERPSPVASSTPASAACAAKRFIVHDVDRRGVRPPLRRRRCRAAGRRPRRGGHEDRPARPRRSRRSTCAEQVDASRSRPGRGPSSAATRSIGAGPGTPPPCWST